MDTAKIKTHLPTVLGYLEKRKKAKQNRLPKHLRPPVTWPLWIQLLLNSGLIVALSHLMVYRDDFLTEAGPAIALVVCFLLMIYALINAVRMRRVYHKIRGHRLAKLNFMLMILAFLFWAGSIVVYLP